MEKKNWNNTIVIINGTMKVDENGKIVFVERKFDKSVKYTATLKVEDDSPFAILARKNIFVFMDGLRQEDVDAFKKLEEAGKIDRTTCWAVTGHLVKSEGKPGMNDLYNLKVMSISVADENKPSVINLDEALTRDEWQVIYKEKRAAKVAASVAPTAPAVPF